MTRSAFRIVAGIFTLGFVVFCIVLACFWVSLHGNAQDVVVNARKGCEFNKLDRTDNGKGWGTAARARERAAAADNATRQTRTNDLRAARRYRRLQARLVARSKVECVKRYPDAQWFNFG